MEFSIILKDFALDLSKTLITNLFGFAFISIGLVLPEIAFHFF